MKLCLSTECSNPFISPQPTTPFSESDLPSLLAPPSISHQNIECVPSSMNDVGETRYLSSVLQDKKPEIFTKNPVSVQTVDNKEILINNSCMSSNDAIIISSSDEDMEETLNLKISSPKTILTEPFHSTVDNTDDEYVLKRKVLSDVSIEHEFPESNHQSNSSDEALSRKC